MADLIFGKNAVLEAFSAKLDIEKVYLLSNMSGAFEVQMRNLCKNQSIPLAKVPEVKLNELSKFKAHQGVIAVISPIKYQDFVSVFQKTKSEEKTPLFIVLDGITDVRNIGAIARTALYFNASGLIISGNFSGQINEDTVKSSAGAILQLPVSRVNSLLTLISDLQSLGIQVMATSLNKDAESPEQCDLTLPTAIILGAEDKGLHYKVLEIVDGSICIQTNSSFDSLNVSVAAGVLLYESFRQRSKK